MKRVYVAGLYSHNADGSVADVVGVLRNIRAGQVAALSVLRAGFAPFCPWLDYQFSLLDDQPILLETYYAYSMAWLEVSDYLLVISGAGIGTGVDREIARAQELGIPVFYSLAELEEYAYSMAWLEVSDYLLVISGAGTGTGVDREIARVQELGIPVFYSLVELEEAVYGCL